MYVQQISVPIKTRGRQQNEANHGSSTKSDTERAASYLFQEKDHARQMRLFNNFFLICLRIDFFFLTLPLLPMPISSLSITMGHRDSNTKQGILSIGGCFILSVSFINQRSVKCQQVVAGLRSSYQ